MEIQFGIISFATEPITIVSISDKEDADGVVEQIENELKYKSEY